MTAHIAVLAKYNSILSDYLSGAWFRNLKVAEMKLPDSSPEDVGIILSYMYTGRMVPAPDVQEAKIEAYINYYILAKTYEIEAMATELNETIPWGIENVSWSHFLRLEDAGLRGSTMWSTLMDVLCTQILQDAGQVSNWNFNCRGVLGGVLEGGMESDPTAAIELLHLISDRLKLIPSPPVWNNATPPLQPMKKNSWDKVDSDTGEVPIDGETHQDCNVETHPNDSNAGARSCWDTDGTEPESNWTITEPRPAWNTNDGPQSGLDTNAGLRTSCSNCHVVTSTDWNNGNAGPLPAVNNCNLEPPSSDWPLPDEVAHRSEQSHLPNIDYNHPEQVERVKQQLCEVLSRLILQPETLRGAPSTTPSASEVAFSDQGSRPGPGNQPRKWLPPWVAACDPDSPGPAYASSARFPASTSVMDSQNRELRQAQDLSDGWN